jgi:hypothetical protein
VCFPKAKLLLPRLGFDVMFWIWGKSVGACWLGVSATVTFAWAGNATSEFRFDRDTFAFANQTVFEYHEGHASLRSSPTKRDAYNRHCFVMCRTAAQFKKFARFEPQSNPLDDASLAARIRTVTRQATWTKPLPEDQRVVFPGYKDLKEMSKAHRELVQLNIGHGWPSYFRISNIRMVFQDGSGYQEQTHSQLNQALARGELFVAFLTTYPRLSINHSVLIYKRRSSSPNPGTDHYLVYDPNHPESPRDLTWSARDRAFSYQKDWDFIGGFVRVYQVYGKPLQ